MPAMCYTSDHCTMCDTEIDSYAKEAYFIQRAKKLCAFYNEPFEPERVRRYLPYWETNGKTATDVESFTWAKDQPLPRVKTKPHHNSKQSDDPQSTVTYRQEFVKCGKPGCRKCTQEQGHGPYWYAYWREGNKVRKRYLGKKFKALWELDQE